MLARRSQSSNSSDSVQYRNEMSDPEDRFHDHQDEDRHYRDERYYSRENITQFQNPNVKYIEEVIDKDPDRRSMKDVWPNPDGQYKRHVDDMDYSDYDIAEEEIPPYRQFHHHDIERPSRPHHSHHSQNHHRNDMERNGDGSLFPEKRYSNNWSQGLHHLDSLSPMFDPEFFAPTHINNFTDEHPDTHTYFNAPDLPEVLHSQEDIDWVERVAKFDPKLKRTRYSIPGAATSMDSNHHLILEEAFKANQMQLDTLRDEDFEFFGVIAEVTPELVKSFFNEQRKLPKNPNRNLLNPNNADNIYGFPSDNTSTTTTYSIPKFSRKRQTAKKSELSKTTATRHITASQERPDNETPREDELVVRKFFPKSHCAIQTRRCPLSLPNDRLCRQCRSKQAFEVCQFQDLRYFYIKSLRDVGDFSKYEFGPDFYSDPRIDKKLLFDDSNLGADEATYILAYTHGPALELFWREEHHVSQAMKRIEDPTINHEGRGDYVRRPLADRRVCDCCKTSLPSGYWMCCSCSREICMECFSNPSAVTLCTKKIQHKREQFVPFGRFHLSTLRNNTKSLRAKIDSLPSDLIANVNNNLNELDDSESGHKRDKLSYRSPHKLSIQNATIEGFRAGWQQGNIVVVSGVDSRFKGDWSPKALMKNGELTGTSWDTKSVETAKITLEDFFTQKAPGPGNRKKWRFMELPLKSLEANVDCNGLMSALPLPEYTSPDGVFNLAKYYPSGQPGVDISPMIHIFQGDTTEPHMLGTVVTSRDMTDNIYICVHSNTSGKKHSGGKYTQKY
ncbi:hypothetical protein BGZ76_011183 [Entomortierella beljakovae]|nr:hypothetical protein BGZ76_011183 [Entomortierella beljakovae]